MMLQMHTENKLLIAVLTLHSLVLFYGFFNLPFSHDELSALHRCRFTNFNALIQLGVMPDGHPAGVQVWLWCYIKLFGNTEWALKLPFAIASIGCSYYLFKCSLKLFNLYAAILSTIIFISLSFFLTQQTYIRPYTIGLLLNLGFFYYALKCTENKYLIANYIGIIIYSTLSYYTHYFSFLQSLMLWLILFLAYVKQINLKFYFISFAITIVLFLPHIDITFYLLKMGGLGWLGKPTFDFIPAFFLQLFNQSWVYVCFSLLLLILAFFQFKKAKKTLILLLFLWLLPFILLWIYSTFRSPVLQYNALYFSTPFLIILLGNGLSFFQNLKIKIGLIIVASLIAFYSLIFSAHFYQKRNYSAIKNFISEAQYQLKQLPQNKALIIWQGNSNYLNFYLKKEANPLAITFADTIKTIDFYAYEYIICNELSPNKMCEINTQFPTIKFKNENYLYSFYVFSKNNNYNLAKKEIDTFQFKLLANQEWSNALEFNLQEKIKDRISFLEVIPHLQMPIANAELVMEISHKNERIDWRSIPLEPKQILSAKLKDILKQNHSLDNIVVKLFIWNKLKIAQNNVSIIVFQRADNPYEYTGKFYP